jgi:hypothetical protein
VEFALIGGGTTVKHEVITLLAQRRPDSETRALPCLDKLCVLASDHIPVKDNDG